MVCSNALVPRLPVEASALMAALQFKNADATDLRRLTQTQWETLLRFCELAHLTLPLAQLRLSGLPPWVTYRLENNLADNALRFERVKSTYREAVGALQNAGVDHLVIKGFTQAPDFVLDPRLRQQSDLDIYCPPNQIGRATTALKSIGYTPDGKLDYSHSDHTPMMLRMGSWTWRGNAFDPDMPLSIELHFCFWNEKILRFPVTGIDQFWQRRITREIGGIEASTLARVDQVAQIGLHILRNLLTRDVSIHLVYECASFLQRHIDDDRLWDSWKEFHPDSLRARTAIAFHLAHCWFGCDLPKAAQSEVEDLPISQSEWLQYFGAACSEGVFVENRDVVWLHWALLPDTTQKLLLLRRTFLPNRIPNPKLPAVVLTDRKPLVPSNGNAVKDFVNYVLHRTASYSKASLETVWRGLSWRISQQ